MKSSTVVFLALAGLLALAFLLAFIVGVPFREEEIEAVSFIPLPANVPVVLSEEPLSEAGWDGLDSCRYRGRVLDVLNIPLPGARLELAHDPNTHTTADQEGRFDWEVPDKRDFAERGMDLKIRVLSNGSAGRTLGVRFQSGATIEIGNVVLQSGGAVSGKVVGVEGEGVRVLCSSAPLPRTGRKLNELWGPEDIQAETRTDAKGNFHLAGVPDGRVRIWAKSKEPGFVYSRPVDVRIGYESQGVLIELAQKD